MVRRGVSRFAVALLVAMCLFGLVGLGGTASATTALPNPCSLLTNTQVAPTVGGKVVLRAATGNRFNRTCTWTGPPMGYMQTSESLILQLGRVSKAAFIAGQSRSSPPPTEIHIVGAPAFLSNVGLSVWKNGLDLEMYNTYMTVYPATAVALAKDALSRI